ncbi:MAG: redoxin domain-containing protein [Pseudomonadota bacterium]|nr:redoxin domain-containing protein [Pseudomonadota bacterium]
MNNRLKAIFISVFLPAVFLALIHSGIQLWQGGFDWGWFGALTANGAIALFFAHLGLRPVVRTSANLSWIVTATTAGTLMALIGAAETTSLWALFYAAGVGFAGSLIYVYWYSRFGRTPSDALAVGQTLPDFSLQDDQGRPVVSKDFLGRSTLFLFFRGNWCPLCMAQIKEIAADYQELHRRGVTVALVSPQSHEKTRALADRFEVPFRFLVDHDLSAAKRLGIVHENALPLGMELLGYEQDAVWPTVVLTDPQGTIIFADQTDNYRVRPEPATFLEVLDAH